MRKLYFNLAISWTGWATKKWTFNVISSTQHEIHVSLTSCFISYFVHRSKSCFRTISDQCKMINIKIGNFPLRHSWPNLFTMGSAQDGQERNVQPHASVQRRWTGCLGHHLLEEYTSLRSIALPHGTLYRSKKWLSHPSKPQETPKSDKDVLMLLRLASSASIHHVRSLLFRYIIERKALRASARQSILVWQLSWWQDDPAEES